MNFLILKSAAKADFFLCTQVLCTYPSFTFFKVPMFVTTRTQATRFLGIFPLKKATLLVFAFIVEFLQLWGFCDRFGITNKLLRIIIGTGFSKLDLVSYVIGILPCYYVELLLSRKTDSGR